MKRSVFILWFRKWSTHLMAIFLVAVMAGVLALQVYAAPDFFRFRFNPYALLSLGAFLANVVVCIQFLRIREHVEGLQWFMLLNVGVGIYGITEFFQRLSATEAGAIFWSQIAFVGVSVIPIGLYLFVDSYVGQQKRSTTILLSLLVLSACLFNFFVANGELIVTTTASPVLTLPWGYIGQAGSGLGIYGLWVSVLYGASLIRLYRFRRSATQQIIRRQSLVFIIAAAIPFLVGIFTDLILPAAGYFVIPLAVVTGTVLSGMVLFGLKRYRLFEIDPQLLSTNILTTMEEAVIVTRSDYTIERCNPEAERLLEVPFEQLHAQPLKDFFEPEAWAYLKAKSTAKHPAEALHRQLYLKGRKGRTTPVRVVATSLRETDDITVYIFVVSDITELALSYQSLEAKNVQINSQNTTLRQNRTQLTQLLDEAHDLQRQLKEEKAGVEHTVEVRTKELVKAQDQLKAAERLKTEFIILSSHNLRTPLTVFLGGLELIKTTRLTAQQTRVVDSIGHSAEQLKHFVEDMLTISQLEAGEQLAQKPATIDSILRPLIDEATVLTKTKDVAFSIKLSDTDAMVNCNTLRLQGGFRNLIHNAFKFTKSGEIKMSATVKAGKILVSITDTGIGIKPTEQSKLFTKFHRGTDVMHYDYDGEGIGLYLTKLIIDDHHGSIEVESKSGKGSTFTVSLPVYKTKN